MVDAEPSVICEKMIDGICIGTPANYTFEYAILTSVIIGIGVGIFFFIRKIKKG